MFTERLVEARWYGNEIILWDRRAAGDAAQHVLDIEECAGKRVAPEDRIEVVEHGCERVVLETFQPRNRTVHHGRNRRDVPFSIDATGRERGARELVFELIEEQQKLVVAHTLILETSSLVDVGPDDGICRALSVGIERHFTVNPLTGDFPGDKRATGIGVDARFNVDTLTLDLANHRNGSGSHFKRASAKGSRIEPAGNRLSAVGQRHVEIGAFYFDVHASDRYDGFVSVDL